MKKFLVTLGALLLGASACVAQTTAVTATVVDSDTTVWANAPWTLAFKVGPSQSNPAAYSIGGVALDKTVAYQTGVADGSGVITFTTYRSGSISPIGSSWNLTVCPNASSKCSTINFTTTGSSQDISTQVNAAILAPRFQAVSGSYGYADVEAILQPKPGSTYYNVASGLRCYNGSSWTSCGGGGAGSPGGANTNVQYNNTGSFGGATHFLTNGSHQAMGASGAIDTGQWNSGFGLAGPTANILNLQETSTSLLGINGIISIVNWNPIGDPTNFGNGSTADVSQLNINFDATGGTTISSAYAQVGSVTTNSNTIVGNTGAVGDYGIVTVNGAAAPKFMSGESGNVFIENASVNNTNGSATGSQGYVEVDAGHVHQVFGVRASYGIFSPASADTAAGVYVPNPGDVSTVTHPYAVKSDDPNPSAYAGLIVTSKGGAVASATSITPTGQIFHVTSTTAVATIVAPAGCTDANQGCQLTLIPDAAFTTTTAGNIALASTAVVNKALIMTYDSGTSKWYPSY